MKTRILILSACVLTFLAACSSKPERPGPPEGYFATYIDQDGTKNFQYTMDVTDSRNRQGNGRPGNVGGHASGSSARGVSGGVTASTGGRTQRGSGSGYELFQQINQQLENSLERELKKSDFCHSGHRETQRVVEPDTIYIRGECTEKATDDDRNRFPNTS